MDWENKFKSIADETDANLAKVKMRLGKTITPASAFSPNRFSTKYSPAHKSSVVSYLPSPPVSHPYLLNGPAQNYTKLSPERTLPLLTDTYKYTGTGLTAGSDQVEERLRQQNKAIDQLRRVVERLETEREQFQQHLRDLRDEISELSYRRGHGTRDPGIDRFGHSVSDSKAELVSRHVEGQVDAVRSQLQELIRQEVDSSQRAENLALRHSQELQQLRRDTRDDAESLRKDIDLLRDRIGKLEQNVSGVVKHRDSSRKHRDPEMFSDFSGRSLSNKQNRLGGDTRLSKVEVAELKSSVSSIKDKLERMEQYIQTSAKDTLTYGSRNHSINDERRAPGSYRPVSSVELLSDDDSVNLEDYRSPAFSGATPLRPMALEYGSDEDLDINDLDLSDDNDLLSDDLLTTNDF